MVVRNSAVAVALSVAPSVEMSLAAWCSHEFGKHWKSVPITHVNRKQPWSSGCCHVLAGSDSLSEEPARACKHTVEVQNIWGLALSWVWFSAQNYVDHEA